MPDYELHDELLDNEREWRRFLIKKVVAIESDFSAISRDIAMMKVWNLVFRLIGGGLFAMFLLWVEAKLK